MGKLVFSHWKLAVGCLLCLLAVGWVSDGLADSRAKEKPLIVVHSGNTPPLSFVGLNGEMKGMVVEYWQLWSKRNDIPIKIVFADWPETLRMIRDGEADIHGGMYFSEGREKNFDFARAYFKLDAAIFVRKELGIESMDDIGTHPVGVLQKGYSEQFLMREYPELQRKSYASASHMMEAAISGDIDVMLCECATMTYLLGQRGENNNFIMLEPLYSRPVQPVVAKGNTALIDLVEKGMDNIPAKESERVFRRWTIPASTYGTWLLVVLVSLFVLTASLLLLMFLRIRRTR